jgi:predicted metal-dependent hydrolase
LRWGSASPSGSIRLNWRVIQAPISLVDYVVAHELVHLRHPNHDRAFWAALGRAMPNYEERKGRLRELGRSLVW